MSKYLEELFYLRPSQYLIQVINKVFTFFVHIFWLSTWKKKICQTDCQPLKRKQNRDK